MDGCQWLVVVGRWEDGEDIIDECGAELTITHGGEGWNCAAGHEKLPLELEFAPWGPAWQREQEEERMGG